MSLHTPGDDLGQHLGDLGKDFLKHSPAEQRMIEEALILGVAGKAFKMAGYNGIGDAMNQQAMQDVLDAHLTPQDMADLYGLARHVL